MITTVIVLNLQIMTDAYQFIIFFIIQSHNYYKMYKLSFLENKNYYIKVF